MFSRNNNPDTVAEFFNCLGSLEHKNSMLFQELAKKSVTDDIKADLLKIANGNEKQSQALITLANQFGGSKRDPRNCKSKIRSVCELTEKLLNQIKNKKVLSAKQLLDILLQLENFGGAMQFLQIQAETFLRMPAEVSHLYKMNIIEFDDHLMSIVNEIEDHIQILEEIKTKLAKSIKPEKSVHHPVVKYSTPDAWYQPRATD